MFSTECLVTEYGNKLASKAVYTRYVDWCRDNGYKPENMKNFRKGMEVHYTYNNSGRPTGGGNPTTVVEDVKFATGEEPEFEVVPDA